MMKSLGVLLQQRTLPELRAIAALWGVPMPPSNDVNDVLRMERLMRDTLAARTVWQHLGPDERTVLQTIVGPAARNWCPVENIPTRVELTPIASESAYARLCQAFIIYEDFAKMQGDELVGQRVAFYGYTHTRTAQTPISERAIAYVPTEISTTLYATGRELGSMQSDRTTLTLDDLLMPYRQGDLDQIGRRFGLTVQTYCSRNEVRAVISDNVSQADAVHYALTQLPPHLSELYEWLIARGGRATTAEVQQRMAWDMPTLLTSLRTYEDYAIAFDAFSEGERVIFIPARTFDNLRRAHARPPVETPDSEHAGPRSVRPADTILLWDIAAFVAGVVHHDMELTRAQVLPKRSAQRLLPLLSNEWVRQNDDAGYRYLAQLQSEVQDLGIAQITSAEDRARLDLGVKLDVWASQDVRMQTHRILRRWPHNRAWHDQVGSNYAGWMASAISISVAREALLNALRTCEPGVWYDVRALLHKVQDNDPFALRPNQRSTSGNGGFKMADDIRAHWDATDGELLCGMLKSTLYELGIVSLGYDSENLPATRAICNPDAICLTELGAEVLKGDLGLAQVPTEHPLVIQPNFEVLLMEPHMPALYWLVRFTEAEQLGRASRFKVTREALLRSMNDGTTLDEIIAFLTQHSQKALPQNVIYTMRDWSRQYKETRLSRVVLIEVDDEQLANELCASVKLRELGLRRVGPLALATPAGIAVRSVRRAIERAGYAAHDPDAPAPTITPMVHG